MLRTVFNGLALVGSLTSAFPLDTPICTNVNQITVCQVSCAQIHIIIARGSKEPPGPGKIGKLAEQIIASNLGTTNESITYPATLDTNKYAYSSAQGTAAMKKQLTDYATGCPSTQFVLLGYSQGAHVVADTLCGGGEFPGSKYTPPIDRAIGGRGERVFDAVPKERAIPC